MHSTLRWASNAHAFDFALVRAGPNASCMRFRTLVASDPFFAVVHAVPGGREVAACHPIFLGRACRPTRFGLWLER